METENYPKDLPMSSCGVDNWPATFEACSWGIFAETRSLRVGDVSEFIANHLLSC
jgi:hypothetical protein